MILFVEDALLEVAAFRILSEKNSAIEVSAVMGRKGYGELLRRNEAIRTSAMYDRFLVMFDSDWIGGGCIGLKIEELFGAMKPQNICVRFACQELENWLLADRENLCSFLGVSTARCPPIDDTHHDAKETIIELARHSRNRTLREGLVPAARFTSKVGPEYLPIMSEFIRDHWNIDDAASVSGSLRRACAEISRL